MTQVPEQQRHSKTQQKGENPWVEGLKTVGLSVVLAIGIRHFVAEARYIPSGSMEPTLQINDRLIIEKLSYHFGDPQRGDVVVFSPTQALEDRNFKDAFIKRVIGLPGETIVVENGQVYVDGKPLSENYIAQGEDTQVGMCFPNDIPYLEEPVTIPADSYLVLGDHRNNSYDSRCWGVVPRDKIIGRAVVRFWPLNRLGGVDSEPPYATTIEK